MIMKVLGIDPGVNTGLAVYCSKSDALEAVFTTDFWGSVEFIDKYIEDAWCINQQVIAVVELSDTRHVWHKSAKSKFKTDAAKVSVGLDVGSVLREATLLVKYLEKRGITTYTVPPAKDGKKDADFFARATGWSKQTNQHSRDAGLLCYRFKPGLLMKTIDQSAKKPKSKGRL
jgi:hypothetical protein